MMPVEEGEEYAGRFKTDMNFKADMNSLDTEQYDKIEADGSFEAWNISYDDGTGGIPMEIQHVSMLFNLNEVQLNAFDAMVGKSDVHATGNLENFIPWYMKDEMISGVLDFSSDYFDADEWMEDEPEENLPVKEEGPTEEVVNESSSGAVEQRDEAVKMSDSVETTGADTVSYTHLRAHET